MAENDLRAEQESTEKSVTRRLLRLPRPPNFNLWGVIRFGIIAFFSFWCFVNYHSDISLDKLESEYRFSDSQKIEIEGMPVHYRMSGKGEVILLLHGDASSLQTWTNWTDKLVDKYQVISVDLPGFGLTGPNPRGSYSSYAYRSFLEKLVNALDLKTFHLVGNGLGGQLAWFYTADHPEKVKKLILLDAFGYPNETPRSVGNWLVRTPFLGEIAEKITPRLLFKHHLQDLWANDALLTDSIVERDFQLFLREGNRAAWADRIRVEDNRPPIDFVKKIAVPTFIIWGAEDTATPTSHAYLFHKDIHKSILKIYEGVGHLPQEEAADQTVRDVRLFLEGKF